MTSSERLAIVHVMDDGERGGVEKCWSGSTKENVFDYDNRGGQAAVVVFVVVTIVTVVTEVRKRKAKSRAPVGRVISSVRLYVRDANSRCKSITCIGNLSARASKSPG